MMNKPWKFILLLAGIFLAGGLTGSLLTARWGRAWFQSRPAPEQWGPVHLRKLAERLELSPAQVEQLRPIVRRNMEELGRLRRQSMSETRTVVERMQHEIAQQLTPEQRAKFDEYNREMRERMHKLMQRRGGEPRGRGEPADEPRRPGEPPREPGA